MTTKPSSPTPAWRRHYTERTAVLGLLLVATGCACVLLFQVRPLAPTDMPTLGLPAAPVRAARQADVELAARVPSAPEVDALDENFLAQGRADHALAEPARAHRVRERERFALRDSVVAAHGEVALWALRARATERFEAAIEGRLPNADLPAIIGMLPNLFASIGLTRAGRELGPPFVARVIYKVRWNRLHGLTPDASLAPIERRAYYGWQVLHDRAASIPDRLEAVGKYAAAGGDHAAEASGVLLFLNGEFSAAEQALAAAYAERPTLRLRNYLAGARLAAAAERRRP